MARRSPRVAVVLVVLAALAHGTLQLPSSPSASAAETEVFVTKARSMTVESDFRRLLYTSFDGCPGGEFPVSCTLRSLPGEGEEASSAVVFRSASREHDLASNVVHDRRHIYWVGAGGDILRIPRHTADPTPTVFAARENASSSSELAIDGTHLYWTENVGESGKVFRASKAGGSRQLMHSNRRSTLRGLRSDGRGGVLYLTSYPAIFLCCFSILERALPDGGVGFITEHADFQAVDSGGYGSAASPPSPARAPPTGLARRRAR